MQLKSVKTGYHVEFLRGDEKEWHRWTNQPYPSAVEARKCVRWLKDIFFNLPVAKGQKRVTVEFRIVRLRITEEVLKVLNLGSE
jgi:hypothetical protein